MNVTYGTSGFGVSSQSTNPGKDFESVEMGKTTEPREKVPRRIIHFSSGETMEEYSTDEEEDPEAERRDLLSPPVDAVRVRSGEGSGSSFFLCV
ncbi:hypothetical protein XENOCAPTIV_022396 [Xenoophorus captivus]|uniref:Uncharacterized protein n=1 Tax=Xenoophorus captivus TaxID=1517983 RepID=A0ABV0QT51_9TELE